MKLSVHVVVLYSHILCVCLFQMYASELQHAPSPHHKVTGGFHLNSKGIELALRVGVTSSHQQSVIGVCFAGVI